MKRDSKTRLIVVSICLAIVNTSIAAAVLVGPFGQGEGGGVIGYSVVRLLILIVPQLLIAIFGVAAAIFARGKGSGWIVGLIANVVAPAGAMVAYF